MQELSAFLSGDLQSKQQNISSMFSAIAPRYDLLNKIMSMGMDSSWRRRAISLASYQDLPKILDVASGTGDFALAAMELKPKKLVCVDPSEAMLRLAKSKMEKKHPHFPFEQIVSTVESLPLQDNSFHLALVAFGVRNFSDLSKGLLELKRVLEPGGELIVLEFSSPTGLWKAPYAMYSRYWMPAIGRLLSGHSQAYSYLPDSISRFYDTSDFALLLTGHGFRNVRSLRLSGGIVSAYIAQKEPGNGVL